MVELIATRVIPGVAFAATFVSAAMVVVAQGVFNPFADTIERVVGGSVMLAAAWLIVRWTRQMLKDLQELREQENKAAVAREAAAITREQMLLDQLTNRNAQIAELNAALTTERTLRMSLEQMGVHDRRHTDPEERA